MFRVAGFMMNHIKSAGDRCNIVLGTHNESSALIAAQTMLDLGIDPRSRQVVFGQIYGMADQISVPLSMAGFTVKNSFNYTFTGDTSFSKFDLQLHFFIACP